MTPAQILDSFPFRYGTGELVFHDFWCQVAIAALLLFACRDNDSCVPEALGVSFGILQWALESHLDGPIADENVTR